MMNQIPAIAGGNPVRSDYLVFGSPSIGEEEISEVTESLRSGWVGMGHWELIGAPGLGDWGQNLF